MKRVPKQITSEREAWLFIARKFERWIRTWTRGDGPGRYGICMAVKMLRDKTHYELRMAMRLRLSEYKELTPSIVTPYFFPLTKAGARQRAKLCRQFAQEVA